VSAEPAKIELRKLKILIVEDDETSEFYLETVLASFGKEIITVRSGGEAVAACQRIPDLDLVMMDIRLPEMDGYEATRQIREFNKEIVIIAQTAYALAGEREKAIAEGCTDYISKPVNKEELLAMMNRYFN
jgi:hypothetical protein